MQTLADLQAKQANEIERLQAELAIAAAAPVLPKRVQLTTLGTPLLHYEAATLTEALAIMNAAGVIPMHRTKAGYTRLQPWEIAAVDAKHDWQDMSGPYACSLHVSQGDGFGPSTELRFFVRCGETICAAHVQLRSGFRDAYQRFGAQYIYKNQTTRAKASLLEIRANNRLAAASQERVKWGTGSTDAAHFDYLFSADTWEGGATEATALILQLEGE